MNDKITLIFATMICTFLLILIGMAGISQYYTEKNQIALYQLLASCGR